MALPKQDIRGATAAVAVTPSDSTDLGATRALWVGGAGNLAVMFVDQTAAVTLVSVPAGTLLPLQVQKVMSTNTTATSITALY